MKTRAKGKQIDLLQQVHNWPLLVFIDIYTCSFANGFSMGINGPGDEPITIETKPLQVWHKQYSDNTRSLQTLTWDKVSGDPDGDRWQMKVVDYAQWPNMLYTVHDLAQCGVSRGLALGHSTNYGTYLPEGNKTIARPMNAHKYQIFRCVWCEVLCYLYNVLSKKKPKFWLYWELPADACIEDVKETRDFANVSH